MDSTHIFYSPGNGHMCQSISSDINTVVYKVLWPQCARLDKVLKEAENTLEIMT